jgi:aryl-alcohol dehydrogenase-like predicted oxidoreductase
MASLITGHATEAGTSEYALSSREAAPDHFREFRGLRLSSLGMGTYLGDDDDATDRRVEEALQEGFRSRLLNVVDTAINYRGQRAERCVGRALQAAVKNRTLRRDQLFLSTKVGYIAPDSQSGIPPRDWVRRELLERGILSERDIVGGSHAMTPEYLKDQIGRSLTNLGISTVDLLYLHNAAEAQIPQVGRARFWERLTLAFQTFESERARGRLRWYGLATWEALRTAPSDPGYLSLEELVRLARSVGGDDPGFRFVQFPFNLAMPEAARVKNQTVTGHRCTLFEAAHRLGLGVFTSVPLLQGRLALGRSAHPGLSPAQTALQFARSAPHQIAPLVGQKSPDHVRANLSLARLPSWPPPVFDSYLRGVRDR